MESKEQSATFFAERVPAVGSRKWSKDQRIWKKKPASPLRPSAISDRGGQPRTESARMFRSCAFLALCLCLLVLDRAASFSAPPVVARWDQLGGPGVLGIQRVGCSSAWRVHLRAPASKRMSRCVPVAMSGAAEGAGGEEEDLEEAAPPLEYEGPIGDRALMESGVAIGNIGLEVMVGPATTEGTGRGLFVALAEGIERTVLPQGTAICGYSREGFWKHESSGDKCVAYAFENVETACFFEKELMPLLDATGQSEAPLDKCVQGHGIFFDEEISRICIAPDVESTDPRYFVPDGSRPVSVANMGMFANDLAFTPGCTEEEYNSKSEEVSVLQLVWRMELDDEGILRPTWPVVILSRDVAFNNDGSRPMEVGVRYGFKYWSEAMLKKML